jgi:hypothetical protein
LFLAFAAAHEERSGSFMAAAAGLVIPGYCLKTEPATGV